MDASPLGPYRATVEIAKFEGEALGPDGLPRDGADPAEVVRRVGWHDPNGSPITDPDRVAALEAALAERSDDRCP